MTKKKMSLKGQEPTFKNIMAVFFFFYYVNALIYTMPSLCDEYLVFQL